MITTLAIIEKTKRMTEAESTIPKLSASLNPLLILSYSSVVGLWAAAQVIEISYVVNLLVLVTSILYSACHNSLILREEQALARGETHPDYPSGDKPLPSGETMRKEDAMQFPLFGSASLFSLYLAFKYLDKDMVNLLISVYFVGIGCLALTITLAPALMHILPAGIGTKGIKNEIKIPHPLPKFLAGDSPWVLSIELNGSEVVAFMGSCVFSYYYFMTKHWALNNVLGICFCLQGIERFSLGTYKIGAILLIGLFFYDIFWVFGTEVMVTVAKNLDGPIKILFPRSLTPNPESGKLDLSLLGLGDIVIPGFFLSLLLRFDAENALVPSIPANPHVHFPKPYFHSCLLAYVCGLALTLYVMIAFNAAQPALLYLVPACLGSSLACAFVRGELGALFRYSEEAENENEENEPSDKTTAEESKKEQ